jgi:hypothetical protein
MTRKPWDAVSLILRRVYNNCGIFKSADETAGKMEVVDVNFFFVQGKWWEFVLCFKAWFSS